VEAEVPAVMETDPRQMIKIRSPIAATSGYALFAGLKKTVEGIGQVFG